MNRRPNILLVMCDQLSALHTSPYGNHAVLTPNLGALAARGTTFVNHYCNAPLCAPSRASLFAGRLAGDIPVNDNAEELPASTPTFVHHLRASGYSTCLSGKMHFVGPDQLHGFEERLTTDIYPADFSWTQRWLPEDGPLKRTGNPPPGAGTRTQSPMTKMVAEAGPVDWSAQLDYDEAVQFKALERVRRYARRRGEAASRPWFLTVSFTQPHDPYAPDREHWDRYDGVDIPSPQPTPPGHQPHITDEWLHTWTGGDEVTPTPEQIARARRGYYGMVSYIDDKVGELLTELDRNGYSEDTIVIFTSDHGDMLGEHGLFFKRTFREASSRVPFIVAGPGVDAGSRVDAVTSLVDLYPTLLELAEVESDLTGAYPLAGASLVAALRGADATDRPAIIENNAEGTRAPTRTVVSGRLKYIHVPGYPDTLFDLAVDPGEWNDVASDPEYADALARLRDICLVDWNGDAASLEIIASQRRRTLVRDALQSGRQTRWDFQPFEDATRSYVRTPQPYPDDPSWNDQSDARAGGR